MYSDFELKILYVEDDKILNEQYQTFLKRRCSKLFVAYNGQEGFESFQKNQPDIVITDIRMPIMDGLEMIKKIREVNKAVPIIVASAYNEESYLLKAINEGVTRYILKPFNRTLLKQIIRETTEFVTLQKKENYFKHINNEYYSMIDNYIIASRLDLNGAITYVSKAFCNISKYSKDDLIGSFFDFNICKDIAKEIWNTIKGDKVWQGEIKNFTKDNEIYWVYATISPIFDNGRKIAYSTVKENITDKKNLEEISIKDALTDIYNRRYYNEKINSILNTSKRRDELICFLMLDVDSFKLYNDNYGHQKGDDVLKNIGKVLKNFMKRADDYAFRLGGEEFALIFNATSPEHAFHFANTIRAGIENLNIKHEFSTTSDNITVSIGLYCDYGKNIECSSLFFKKADDLLYKAKESGKNKVILGKQDPIK